MEISICTLYHVAGRSLPPILYGDIIECSDKCAIEMDGLYWEPARSLNMHATTQV